VVVEIVVDIGESDIADDSAVRAIDFAGCDADVRLVDTRGERVGSDDDCSGALGSDRISIDDGARSSVESCDDIARNSDALSDAFDGCDAVSDFRPRFDVDVGCHVHGK